MGEWTRGVKPDRFETICKYCEKPVLRWKSPALFCNQFCARRYVGSGNLLEQQVLWFCGLRRCGQCKEIKELDKFWFLHGKPSVCKLCGNVKQQKRRETTTYGPDDKSRLRAKKWRENNPDLFKGRIRAWHLDHPENARRLAHKRRKNIRVNGLLDVSQQELDRLLARQRFTCYICSDDISDRSNRQIDHIIPVKLRGRHSIGNLAWACRRCNRAKHAKLLIQFKKEISWFPYLP